MEPIKPSDKKAILSSRPDAAPEDIEEYELLLSKRFAFDPDFPRARFAASQPAPDRDEVRLRELYKKLFGHS